MIVKISEKKCIWFGYECGPNIISFKEAVYMMLDSQGYSKDYVQSQFKKPGGDMLISRMLKKGLPDLKEVEFIERVRHYLEAFKTSPFAHPDKASILSTKGVSKGIIEAGQLTGAIVRYMATI